jgi:hypothetical protein
MKKTYLRRRSFVRLRSRHDRYGLGFHHAPALWRNDEYGPDYRHTKNHGNRFRERAWAVPYWRRFLRETDPQVFYRSPFVPRPHYDPDAFLPHRLRRRDG